MTNLKTLRMSTGLTQSEFAERANVNVRVLQHYEQGSKNIDGAKIETLLSIANVIGCRISDIVENEELKTKLKDSGY